ncbi:hypothetical protein R3P38DRAFT_3334211 [Favolaschia claudopus]|uniref:Uncharacterized protein n=1 Tax=Favolaschia claudopus TaxID=2862362 RepID=A0AAV9ZDN5_9AGAR
MSSASIFVLAVLENSRVIDETKTVARIGSLRYFNSDNQDFADVGCYCAVIQVYSQELAPLDYHFFGDIVSIMPLGSSDTLNIRTHATVRSEPYLSATKTPENTFSVHCKYKPIPGKGKSVSVEGLLAGLELNDDRSVKHFIVDIEKVSFLGNASSTAPKAEEINTGTPARLKFTGFFGDQAPISTNTSEPNPKKRKLDQHANEPQDNGRRSGGGANKHSIIKCPVFVEPIQVSNFSSLIVSHARSHRSVARVTARFMIKCFV